MYKPLIFVFFVTLLSCSNPQSSENASSAAPETGMNEPARDDVTPIPEMPAMDFSEQWLDSTRSYGAGDCFGNIYRYTKEGKYYAADSLACGEYGFTFTHYLLDSSGFLLTVRELKWESILNNEGDDYDHLLSERVYDFQRDPALTYLRSDTLTEHYMSRGYPDQVEKPFDRQSLELKESIYESLMFRYQKAWQR